MHQRVLITTFTFLSVFSTLTIADSNGRDIFDLTLEELTQVPVIVTARKREENNQTIPVAVTALSNSLIETRQIDKLSDLGRQIPSLITSPALGVETNPRLFMRGLGQGETVVPTAESAVGIYVDDVYIGRLNGANFYLLDAKRVEVLRGPQGTLYGRNTLTGAINIISNKPSKETDVRASLYIDDQPSNRLSVAANTAATDNWAIRYTGLISDSDGYVDRYSAPGTKIQSDAGEQEQNSHKLALRYIGDGKLQGDVSIYHIDEEGEGRYPIAVSATDGSPLSGAGFYSNLSTTEQMADLEQFGASLQLSSSIGEYNWKSITAYREVEEQSLIDISGLGFINIHSDIETEQWTQEFQVSRTLMNERLYWIGGVFLFKEDNRSEVETSQLQLFELDTDSFALFGELTYSLTDTLDLTLGGRFTRDDKLFSGVLTDTGIPTNSGTSNLSETYKNFTPKVALSYRHNDKMMFYSSLTQGFKAGGFQARPSNASGMNNDYEPETVLTYEQGFKGDLSDNIRFNAAYYYSKFEDLQLNTSVLGSGTVIQNAGEARVHGIELEVNWAVSQNLSAYATYATTWDEYKELDDNIIGIGIDDDLPETPTAKGLVGFDYKFQLNDLGVWSTGMDYQHISARNPGAANNDVAKIPRLDLFNGYIRFAEKGERWDVGLYGENLGDKEYSYVGLDFTNFFNSGALYPAEPRTIKLKLNYHFK